MPRTVSGSHEPIRATDPLKSSSIPQKKRDKSGKDSQLEGQTRKTPSRLDPSGAKL
jgi:hypothetical protein